MPRYWQWNWASARPDASSFGKNPPFQTRVECIESVVLPDQRPAISQFEFNVIGRFPLVGNVFAGLEGQSIRAFVSKSEFCQQILAEKDGNRLRFLLGC